jgi:hypothetical protein
MLSLRCHRIPRQQSDAPGRIGAFGGCARCRREYKRDHSGSELYNTLDIIQYRP